MIFNEDFIPAYIEQIKKNLELAKRGENKKDTVEGLEELLSFIKNSSKKELIDFLNNLEVNGIDGVLSATKKADIIVEEKYRNMVRRDSNNQTSESTDRLNTNQRDARNERCLALRKDGKTWKQIAKLEHPNLMDHQIDKMAAHLRATVNRYKRINKPKNKSGTKRNI